MWRRDLKEKYFRLKGVNEEDEEKIKERRQTRGGGRGEVRRTRAEDKGREETKVGSRMWRGVEEGEETKERRMWGGNGEETMNGEETKGNDIKKGRRRKTW